MRLLVLESDFSIQSQFRTTYMGNEMEFAPSADQCKALLKFASWDVLFLGCLYSPDSPAVADWLSVNPACKPPTIVLYVSDPLARSSIQGSLPSSIYSPYAYSHSCLGP